MLQAPCSAHLLLVEDDPSDLALIRAYLADFPDVTTIHACSVAAAISVARTQQVDAALVDLGLPDGHGLEVVRQIRHAIGEIPMIVLTGRDCTDLSLARAAVSAGAQDYLPKSSLDAQTLSRALLMALERQRLQDTLRQREHQLQRARKLARLAFWQWDGKSSYLECTPELGELLGLPVTRGRMAAIAIYRRIAAEDRPLLADALRSDRRGQRCDFQLDLRVLLPDGCERDLTVDARHARNGRQDSRAMHGICQDVTERNKLKRMQEEMISVVSHELRTPLTGIRGALGLLGGLDADRLSERQHDLLRMAGDNGERMQSLIDNLIDLDQIAHRSLRLDRRPVHLGPLLAEIASAAQAEAKREEITIDVESEAGQIVCLADAKRLKGMIAELVANAIKYSPPASMVRLRATMVGEMARITVTDQGKGIAPEVGSMVFEPFVQADSSASRSNEGTGLGLAVVRRLAELHGGSCRFRSRRGGGTVFELRVPILAT